MHKAEKSEVATSSRVKEEDRLTTTHWKRNLAVCVFGSFTTIASMTLVVPFLPLYVEQLGAQGRASIAEWSGACFAAAFFTAGLVAPLWGKLADRYGGKLMLIRASLGMAVGMSLMGMVGNVWQFFGLRLLVGFLGGYASSAMVLVATQSPKNRSGWALGMLSSGVMAGNLVGPLVGGVLPQRIGIRENQRSLFVRRTRLGSFRLNTNNWCRSDAFSASSRTLDFNGEVRRASPNQNSPIIPPT